MDDFKNILFPLDKRENTDLAFEKALKLVRTTKGAITLVKIIPPMESRSYKLTGEDEFREKQQVLDDMDRWIDRIKDENLTVHKDVRYGLPAVEINAMSGEFDLIIMGRDREKNLSSMIIGSVLDNVIKESKCPVMVVG